MTTGVRRATTADAAALAELRWEFRAGREPAAEDHDAFIVRCAAWMRHELEGDVWRAWAAMDDSGVIVGQVWANLIQKVPNPVGERERHAYISNLYVNPNARGGTGTALLEAALAWADANGIDSVVLWPTERSVPLYRRHQFSHDSRVMERKR
jgi:GNAT superfamily N-acetyltransferase